MKGAKLNPFIRVMPYAIYHGRKEKEGTMPAARTVL